MGAIREIVFDCQVPSALARFWAEVLDGYAVREYDQLELVRLAVFDLTPETDPHVFVDGPGPTLCFQNIDDRKPDNNRVHLEIEVSDRRGEVERLTALGATVERVLPTYTVLKDPEGNQFCINDESKAMAA